ncbi:MAG: TonB-dependent receptor [Bacteroidaceae bacterium]|nr:TonB-dependent receptor [Bacteroidaceae bacterium]
MKKIARIFLSVIVMLCCSLSAMAQNIEVKGTVTDKQYGDPIIGATVKEVGNESNAVITDFDGNFTLSVANGAQLQFTYVGMQTMVLPASAQMNVVMEDEANSLQEVVVTGYTTQRKADLTGAVSVVSVSELAKQNENNPMKALQGRVPGMNISADGNPSGAATVRIRGNGTLNNNDPLYIIDGVPTKAGMHELNGSDIESIQVLKDAASASIYGSRAANGVIIITTKRGKNGKVQVDFDASVAASMYAHRMKVLNAEQWGQAFWQARVNDGLDPNNNNLGYHFNWGYDQNGNPQLNGVQMSQYLDANNTVQASNTDWFKESTRTGIVQNYNVNVSNGNEKGSSFFSLGYYKNLGVIKNSDFERFSARINTEYKLIDDILTIGENFTLNRTDEASAPGGFLENALQFNPNYPIYNINGNYANLTGGYADRENPLSTLSRAKDNRYNYWRTFGDVHLNLALFKDFNVRTTFGIDYSQKQQRFFTYPVVGGNVSRDENGVEAKQEHWMKWMWNAIATYKFEKGAHRADAMVGMELNRQDDVWFSGYRQDFAVLNPDYMWPSAGTEGTDKAYGGGGGYSLVSFFGKANYTYADKYLASLTIRRDGSSRFGKNNKYGTFPSISLGWRISEEKWLKDNASWIENLKLRASWGQTGNQEIDNNARYTLYTTTGSLNFGGDSYNTGYDIQGTNGGQILDSGFKRDQIGNDDIKWETTTQTNFGIDFGFLNGALYGALDWYNKKTTDILVHMPGVAVMGEGSWMWINAGEMLNRGLELNIGYRGKAGELQYDINGNIGTNYNEVTKLPETIAANGTFGGNGVESVVGHPMGAQVGYVFDGIFQNQDEVDNHATQEGAAVGRMRFKDLNGDGVVNSKDQKWIYDPSPAFTYGLNAYIQYKNFDFTMFWQGVQGVDVITKDYKQQTDLWAGVNVPNLNKGIRVLDAWSPTNTGSTIPALTTMDTNNETRMSTYYVENGSYLKLRTVQFGYNFPEAIAKKLCMSRLRMYLSAQNVLTIKSGNYSGNDPEVPTFGYPIPMNVTFGLNVSF